MNISTALSDDMTGGEKEERGEGTHNPGPRPSPCSFSDIGLTQTAYGFGRPRDATVRFPRSVAEFHPGSIVLLASFRLVARRRARVDSIQNSKGGDGKPICGGVLRHKHGGRGKVLKVTF